MKNKDALNFFNEVVTINKQAGSEKLKSKNDNTHIDATFILQYADYKTSILDIASGSGLIINKIAPYVKHITAVEPFSELTNHICKCKRIRVINENVFNVTFTETFDLITLFGFMHYLNEKEAKIIYNKCMNWLNPLGVVIIKNQFAISKSIIVDGFSKELGTNYYANYRTLNQEINILKDIGFNQVEHFDIYPREKNRWDDTHFYAIVARKGSK